MSYPWIVAFVVVAVCAVGVAVSLWATLRRLVSLIEAGGLQLSAFRPVATDAEPKIGDQIPYFVLVDEDGHTLKSLELSKAGSVLLLFLTPGCGPCAAVSNEVRLHGWQAAVRLTAVLPPVSRESKVDLGAYAWILHQNEQMDATRALQPPGTPYAILIGPTGRLLARGPAHTLEKLKELAAHVADDNPVPSGLSSALKRLVIHP